jgi:hypothetical protein
MHEVDNFLFNYQIHGSLGCHKWVFIPQNVKKIQNHCTLVYIPEVHTDQTELNSVSSENFW